MKNQDNLLLALEDSAFFLLQSLLMLEYERCHSHAKCNCNLEKFSEVNAFILEKIDELLSQDQSKKWEYDLNLESDWQCKKQNQEILRFDLLQAFWWEYQNNNFTIFDQRTDYFGIPYTTLKDLFFSWTNEIFRKFPVHAQHINILAIQHNLRSMNQLYSIDDYFVELYVSYHCIYQRLLQTPEDISKIIENINHLAPFKDLTQGGSDFQVLEKKSNQSDFLIGLQVPIKAQSNMIDVLHKVFLQMISMLLLNHKKNQPSEIQLQQAVEIASNLLILQKRNNYPLTQRKSPLKALEALLYQNFKKEHPTQNANEFMKYLEQLFIEKGFKTSHSRSKTHGSDRQTPVNTNDLTLRINIQNLLPLNEYRENLAKYPRTVKIGKILKHLEQHSEIEICFGSVRKNAVNISTRFNEYFSSNNEDEIVKIHHPVSKQSLITTINLQNLHNAEASHSIEQMLKNIEERRK
ncbi:hypothetical protein KTI63_10025 [Acinetobacter guillouiae]|uniref:hypothetical protein n=1 Tax=Acinetobacter guillouiae TaxID=106649 RepID=UPI0021D07871|nr:hypothetical protein [Acinetobacter guillouiae]MCU4492804.1 hypothetical protein [Acinetobacter guillouiae]